VIDFVLKAIPHKACIPAQSPFHKQLTEKRKDGRLFHLLASKNRMWLAQFVCPPQFFKTPSGLCGHTVHPFVWGRKILPPASFYFSYGAMLMDSWKT
jgi:hypothetical protein